MTGYMCPADPTVTHCYHAAKVNELIAERDAEIERLREWNREIALNARELVAEIERLRAALRDAYEIYAGSDGFIPATAAEGYQQQIIRQMVECISAALDGQPAPGKVEPRTDSRYNNAERIFGDG